MIRLITVRFNLFALVVLTALFGVQSTAAGSDCPKPDKLLTNLFVKSTKSKELYPTLFSTDVDFIRTEAQLAEGPPPQRNMSMIGPHGQFRFSDEAGEILELKKRLVSRFRNKIIAVEKGQAGAVLAAAREQFEMMSNEFPEAFPKVFHREGDVLVNHLTGDRISPKDFTDANTSLEKLGQLVPDDLILMKKRGSEYHLIGGNLAFPTHWSIEGALGESISDIHSRIGLTVKDAASFSQMINHVLDRMLQSPDVIRRNNWFIELDPRYPLPSYLSVPYDAPKLITKNNYLNSTFFRTERQTLRGLPKSETVMFAIHPMVFPMSKIAEQPDLAVKVLEGLKVKLLPLKGEPTHIKTIALNLEKGLAREAGIAQTNVIATSRVNESTYLIRVKKPVDLGLVPGEAARVTIDTPHGKMSRVLSVANSPEHDYLEFATRDSDSAFKTVFKSLKNGNNVRVELLRTSLGFKPNEPTVMIAGGVGITPFRSFIQFAKDKKLKTPMWLFYGNRTEIAFEDELAQAAAKNSRLKVTHVLSKAPENWQGARGRIDEAFLQKTVSDLPADANYYIVASPQMVEDTKAALIKLGVKEERISTESFTQHSDAKAAQKPTIDPKTVPDDQRVCYCRKVSAGTIRAAIRNGANTMDAVKAETKAGTACGGCACNVMGILECELR